MFGDRPRACSDFHKTSYNAAIGMERHHKPRLRGLTSSCVGFVKSLEAMLNQPLVICNLNGRIVCAGILFYDIFTYSEMNVNCKIVSANRCSAHQGSFRSPLYVSGSSFCMNVTDKEWRRGSPNTSPSQVVTTHSQF